MALLVRNDDYRLRNGTFTSSGITSAYSIPNWTVQADQIQDNQTVVQWLGPYQAQPPEYARITSTLDGTSRPDGFLQGWLFFPYWTFGMMNYFLTTYEPGGVYSAATSLLVYDATDTPVYLNASLQRPVIGQDFQPEVGGWKNIKITYNYGVVTS